MNIQNVDQLKQVVRHILAQGKTSEVLASAGDVVQKYYHGEHTRLVDNPILDDTENVIDALKTDLNDYVDSLMRDELHDTTPIQRSAQKINEVHRADEQGYDLWDVSEDADRAFVIDADYVMDVIDYTENAYRFHQVMKKENIE